METIHPIILNILEKRGISNKSDILEFISKKPKLTYDPFLLLNLEAGVDLILSAIKSDKKICIYGDYDADGVTSICLMLQVLSHLTNNITYYIPSRFSEGYGLNKNAIDIIKNRGTDLIITVDCGSVSFDEVEYAKQLGMDILVTDHHNLNDKPVDCLLINPKQEFCQYPFKHLAGCGVAFKVAQGIQRKANLPKSLLTEVLDLVAIATIGDIVPLIDENRTLVKYGLEAINKGYRKGLNELIKSVGLTIGKVKSDHIAYVIVPHLNAAGRMCDAKIGVDLLISNDENQIKKSVDSLIENNKKRKNIQEETFKKCLQLVEEKYKEDLFLIIDAKEAHEGIAGIVAGKVKDKTIKPTIIVTLDNANDVEGEIYLKGTGRSIDGVDLYKLLKTHEELFEKFGGHSGACGFKIKAESINLLRESLNEDVKEILQSNPHIFEEKINIDAEIINEDINFNFINQLEELEPFGHKNEKPIFEMKNIKASKVTYMGKDKQHVKFNVQDNNKVLTCVLFNYLKEYNEIKSDFSYTIIGYPDVNVWNGKSQIQMLIRKISEDIKYVNDEKT
ncbi:single-stranded-DNA-specific exonuclease RecJ [Anaerovorax odorimutans]|uniref:single-stranded-DNA-specific exonuclease RecJ n=1 Tax=Anaerovorax odorimutans TaxID=109327 RepID=UPI0004879EA6|nr:single-stranded-DNA-specific exonuclease RecJ [Anaerovorax odorimutans]